MSAAREFIHAQKKGPVDGLSLFFWETNWIQKRNEVTEIRQLEFPTRR